MGLDEPDIDLSDLVDSSDNNTGGSGEDISNMDRKDLCKKVVKEGQVNLGDNRALIKCPCENPDRPLETVMMCALSMRPDPETGKQKPVCGGPIEGWALMAGDFHTWVGGKSVINGCPYSPSRFKNQEKKP